MIELFWSKLRDHREYYLTGGTGLLLVLYFLVDRTDLGPRWLSTSVGLMAILLGGYPLLTKVYANLRARRISVADVLRDDAALAVSELSTLDIQMAMHIGDNSRTAKTIGSHLGIERVVSELLPEDKVAAIATLQAEGRRVAMVGDGINDAPAMATADVGVAMGAIGTDVTVKVSDVALMADNLDKIPQAIRLGRAALSVIRQDIAFALAFNAAMLLLASSGLLSMVAGAILHQASSLAVALNAMRLLLYRPGSSKP